MIRRYCMGCGYVYASAADRTMHDRRCGPDDLPAGQEVEPSAREPALGMAARSNTELRERLDKQERFFGIEQSDRYREGE